MFRKKHWPRCFWRCLKKPKHRINDASNDVNRPPLEGGGSTWLGQKTKFFDRFNLRAPLTPRPTLRLIPCLRELTSTHPSPGPGLRSFALISSRVPLSQWRRPWGMPSWTSPTSTMSFLLEDQPGFPRFKSCWWISSTERSLTSQCKCSKSFWSRC